MSAIWQTGVIALLLVADSACTEQPADVQGLAGFSFDQHAQHRWKLPSRLKEISGLAMTPDGRLLAVDDERAIVYEIDYDTGRLIKQFAFGRPVLRGDFEGIAYVEGHLFLITSNGLLYAAPEGDDGEQVVFETFDTGIGRQCEIEGLAQDIEERRLLIMCRKMADNDVPLLVFFWRLSDRRVDKDERLEMPVRAIQARLGTRDWQPSGIAIHPLTGSIFVVSAKQRALVELDRKGNFVDAIMVPKKRHRQAEGIELSHAGKLIIADEGGQSRARLTVYTPVD